MAEDLVRLQAVQDLEREGRGEWAWDPREALRTPEGPSGPRRRVKKRPARAVSSPPVDRDITSIVAAGPHKGGKDQLQLPKRPLREADIPPMHGSAET